MTSDRDKPTDDGCREDRNRKWLLIFSALYITFFAGAFFGWGPMQLMLEENGAFEERCDSQDEELPCASQTTRLLNVQLVAQLVMVFAPFLGALADKRGTVSLMYLTAACGCAGLALLTLATSENLDNLLWFTFILLGFMAISSSIMIVQTGLLFGAKTRQRVISVLNTFYDAGALTYLALWGIMQATGAALGLLAGVYLAVGVLCFGGAVHFWRVVVPVHGGNNLDTEEAVEPGDAEMTAHVDTDDIDDFTPGMERPTGEEEKSEIEPGKESSSVIAQECDKDSTSRPEQPSDTNSDANDPPPPTISEEYVLIANRPPMQQLRSKQFVMLVIFYAYYGARNVFTLTTARDFLAYLGDDETGNKYLTIFVLLTPASVAALPFMDWIVNHCGYHAALQSINVLAIAHGTIQVSSENLNVQILGFIVFSFFRCFLFTIVFSFLPTFMGMPVVGRAAGIMTCAFGIFAFINIPLANLAVNQFGGNFFWPNLFYTVASVLFIYVAWILGKGVQKEEQAKEVLKITACDDNR